MIIKKIGKEIIYYLKHPIAFIVAVWLFFSLLKKMKEDYDKDTALERMIYKK